MHPFAYADFVASRKKAGEDIIRHMTPDQADALHMAVGVAEEGGEVLSAVKRWAIYQKPIDLAKVVEELGDLEFFMEGLRQRLGITREHVLEENVAKLSKRYKEGYTDAEAHARADEA